MTVFRQPLATRNQERTEGLVLSPTSLPKPYTDTKLRVFLDEERFWWVGAYQSLLTPLVRNIFFRVSLMGRGVKDFQFWYIALMKYSI